jgi:hypothetical protein
VKTSDWLPPGAVAVVGALASIVVAWIAAHVTVKNTLKTAEASTETNNKTLFVTAITAERAKWRHELRLATAEFVRLAHEGLAGTAADFLPKLHEHRLLIFLRVNPNANHKTDAAILAAVKKIPGLVRDGRKDKALSCLAALETSVQTLLKAEWEKSKTEAITGKLQITDPLVLHASKP